jgi:aspartate racemase
VTPTPAPAPGAAGPAPRATKPQHIGIVACSVAALCYRTVCAEGAAPLGLICPDNTIHQAFDPVAKASPLPWLHIAEVAAAEATARGCHRLGLMGTRWLVDSDVYPRKLGARGIACVLPTDLERDETVAGGGIASVVA